MRKLKSCSEAVLEKEMHYSILKEEQTTVALQNRTIIRGDNLEEMRKFPDACVDLIATDPPFNSKRDYFVPYRDEHGNEPDSLVKAFTDTWTWGPAAAQACEELICNVGGKIGETIYGLQQFLAETPMMAYLAMMAVRIVEMHRILKSTGSLYLHCDPTASHYLKIIIDAIFGYNNFQNEIVWHYGKWTNVSGQFQRNHDIIFFYSKSENYTFNQLFNITKSRDTLYERGWDTNRVDGKSQLIVYDEEKAKAKIESGKYEKIIDRTDKKGVVLSDGWQDIPILNSQAKERAGYPTQKPIALYKRIIQASSNKGDLVLDPFCGCGTTLMAAEELNRRWLGIDLTYLATGAVKLQVEKFFPQLKNNVTITGTPENTETLLQLARNDPAGFEEWCVTHVLKFKSNPKKVADGGIDGNYRFPIGKVKGRQAYGKMVAQVKGGNFTLDQIRAFRTAMENVKADLGIFVVTKQPTQGMLNEALKSGTWRHPLWDMEYPRFQIYQIQDYFEGAKPKIPVGERSVL